MLLRFESLAWEYLPIDELHGTVRRLTRAGTTDPALLERAEDLCEIRDQIRDKKANTAVAAVDESDDTGYKSLPILPEWKEIKEDNGTPPEVRPNKVDAPYKDWMEYYDIQFRLVREDFIAPLRRGVTTFLQGDKGKKNRDVKTYSGVTIVSQVTTKEKGICFNVKFDVSRFRNYNWSVTKRLIFGSLLCFIPTHENPESTVLFATVAESDSLKLKEGKVMVQFEKDILEAMTYCRNETEFEIIESNVYFEATSPILRSIQTANTETMPFTKQIIHGDCGTVLPPVYLRANEEESPIYNLTCLYGSKRRLKMLRVNVLEKESWEAANDSELDSSQLSAIQTALTQEIAVIQGPPGTGKNLHWVKDS
ncbi:NFX1-type zinc finger-containing protein 1 [Geodia barretti]|uniref:NFX1-type zinc finger-containing protein 1 n=1 Tax=Geodia barretti TaxID=519541 RepID=A0AA35T519_GEOBA|nr:NFX1-type zinc finger-containing protein 1 [Geodia barretti]